MPSVCWCIGADIRSSALAAAQMLVEAREVRSGRPVIGTDCRADVGVDLVAERIADEVLL